MVGYAIARTLIQNGHDINDLWAGTRADGDLEDYDVVERIFQNFHPEYVFLAAAMVGGIFANATYPADFIRSNLAIQTNIIENCHRFDIKKLLFLGSSCIYPKNCPQPIREEYLMTGPLEPTNQAYAMAKLAGIEMCRAYKEQFKLNSVSVMPTNLYGPGDNYHPQNSHVIPGLIQKIYQAKIEDKHEVKIWGDGTPLREFMHVSDCADACIYIMEKYNDDEIINIGSGQEYKIYDVALLIKELIGYKGEITRSYPDMNGTPRKLLDCTKLHELGWIPQISLAKGLERTIKEYVDGQTKPKSN